MERMTSTTLNELIERGAADKAAERKHAEVGAVIEESGVEGV